MHNETIAGGKAWDVTQMEAGLPKTAILPRLRRKL